MRIHSLSLILATPFLLALGIMLPLTFSKDSLMTWLIVPVMGLILIYLFRPQIDYWWLKKARPPLEKKLVKWLNSHSRFYNSLSSIEKEEFSRRCNLLMSSKEFTIKSSEDHSLSEELKLLSIHEAIKITFGLDDFEFLSFDRIILYPHPFPTPKHKELHIVETEKEDGVVLMSLPHLVNGFLRPDQYFNIGLYAWLECFVLENVDNDFIIIADEDMEKLNTIFPYSIDKIRNVIGLGFVDRLGLHAQAYFDFPDQYEPVFGYNKKVFDDIFFKKKS